MRNYGMTTCIDCGQQTIRNAAIVLRCRPCAAAIAKIRGSYANRRKPCKRYYKHKHNMERSMVCVDCGKTCERRAASQKRCLNCRKIQESVMRRSHYIRKELPARRASGMKEIGAEEICGNCKQTFIRTGPLHEYCVICRPARRRASAAKFARKYYKQKRTDPIFRLNARIRSGVRKALVNKSEAREWPKLLGFGVNELMRDFESKFLPGMGWHNIAEWHIDHIRPLSSFTYSSPKDPDFHKCWALANLAPLWARDNLRKGNRPG